MSGFYTNPMKIDYPLEVIQSYEDYSRISLKQLYSFPEVLFYDTAFPIGTVYPWPIPIPQIYELHIITKTQLAGITDPTLDVALPPEYEAAIVYNLATRLAANYGKAMREDVYRLAKTALNVIRNANTQISTLQMPTTLLRSGIYNPYSDRTR